VKALRFGILAVLAFSVLAFGGVEVWGESIIEISAALLLMVWAVFCWRNPHENIQWNVLNWPLLGLLAVGIFQLLLRGTAYPFLTRVELLKLASYFIVFFLAAQAFRTKSDFQVVAWFLILFCFAVSLLAIIQHFTSIKEIYWLSELNIQGDPFGPFPNRNHFAGFVELTLPVGLALMAFQGMRRDLLPLAAVLTIVPVSAMILSGSRGGIISFAFEVCVLALLVRSRKSIEGPRMAAVGIVALTALALIAWIGAGKAIARFSTLPTKDVSIERRASMFRGALGVLLDHPIKGAGLGTLIAVYPRHETVYDGYVVEHVHDDYIEALAETGILGGLCGLGFLWLLYQEARKNFEAEQSHFSRGLHAGAIVALSGLLLHSFMDFNLHIPSNALLFLVQAYIATSVPLYSGSGAAVRNAPGLQQTSASNDEPPPVSRGRMTLVRRSRHR
jgi:O-antigen ligase